MDGSELDRRIGELFSEGLSLGAVAEKTGCPVEEVLRRQAGHQAQQVYRSRLQAARMTAYALAVRRTGEMLSSENAALQQKAVHEALSSFAGCASARPGRVEVRLVNAPEKKKSEQAP